MKKILSISSIALCGLLWAQQSLDITSTTGNKTLLVSEILGIVPGVKTTTFKLVGGSTYSAPTAGQKWILNNSSSSSSSSSGQVVPVQALNQIHWQEQNHQITVNSTLPTQFQLFNLSGQELSTSPSPTLSWQFSTPSGVYILRTFDKSNVKSFLIQTGESK